MDRVGPLIGAVLADGAGADSELRDFLATIESERRTGNTGLVTHIRDKFGLPGGLERANGGYVCVVARRGLIDRALAPMPGVVSGALRMVGAASTVTCARPDVPRRRARPAAASSSPRATPARCAARAGSRPRG